ncbi:uncharacterized protein [Ptychodera flava]|uniref:uncharacterized protein isoform X1 n=1 Tax=Ptychodera flava TaxID=63121 RepID=UPI00396A7445
MTQIFIPCGKHRPTCKKPGDQRIADSTRQGGPKKRGFKMKRLEEAADDPSTGITDDALTGSNKQCVGDCEKLLNLQVANWLLSHGYRTEYEHVYTIAKWHRASDDRGMTQDERQEANMNMYRYILDELLPWHRKCLDLSSIDVNMKWSACGFTREILVGIFANICDQERRRHNSLSPEHPRASTTDDVECFFPTAHQHLGDCFTLKDWKQYFPHLCEVHSRRLDSNIPFYYYTSDNERYSMDPLPSFDLPKSNNKPSRLLQQHRVPRRDVLAAVIPGRANFPVHGAQTIRTHFHNNTHTVPKPPCQI